MSEPFAIALSPEAVDAIVERVADLVLQRLDGKNGSPWLTRRAAADYLGLPLSRLEKDRRIPCHRDGRRVLYHRAELDEYMRRG